MRGWRGIPLKGPFTLQETLYGSHQEKQDHLAVDDASNGETFCASVQKSADRA